MNVFRPAGIALIAVLAFAGIASSQQAFVAGKWTKVTAAGPSAAGHMLLLTDGSVLVINSDCSVTASWFRLVPSATGSYSGGKWDGRVGTPIGVHASVVVSSTQKFPTSASVR